MTSVISGSIDFDKEVDYVSFPEKNEDGYDDAEPSGHSDQPELL